MKVTRSIDFFQQLYMRSRNGRDEAFKNVAEWRAQYYGTQRTGGVPTPMVRNITYELIESQVSTNVPRPRVDPEVWSEHNDRNAKSIERLCTMLQNKLQVERINDQDERTTYIEGADIFFVEWDNSLIEHNEYGGIALTTISPEDFFPQPGVYEVQDMDWMILRFRSTRQEIMDKYHVSMPVAEEAGKEDMSLHEEEMVDPDTVTVMMGLYRGEDGKIGQFVWSANVVLLDIPDYYCRKREVCEKCGRRKDSSIPGKQCECGGSFILDNDEYEELTHDIVLGEGETQRTLLSVMPEYDENGNAVLEEAEEMITDENGNAVMTEVEGVMLPMTRKIKRQKMTSTKIPWYIPKHMPVVVRKNTSKRWSALGQSDCEFIRFHQEEINKIESRIHEKIQSAGTYPFKPENVTFEMDNTIGEKVMNIPQGTNPGLIGTIDMTPNIGIEQSQSAVLYDQAKKLLGITDSYQGQADTTAKSGVAKQAQIQQAAGRLESKRVMKNAAWADIFRIWFEYYLAYADEPRKLVYTDGMGKRHNAEFNRYDFVEYDNVTKEYFYNDRYLFSVDQNGGVEQQRETMWQLNQNNLQIGALGNPSELATLLRYWQLQEMAHYPHARENVEYFKTLIQEQQAAQQQIAPQAIPIPQGGMANGNR